MSRRSTELRKKYRQHTVVMNQSHTDKKSSPWVARGSRESAIAALTPRAHKGVTATPKQDFVERLAALAR